MVEPTEPAVQGPRLMSLTPELLILIFDQCQFIDLLALSSTCRRLNTLRQGLDTKRIDLDSGARSMHILHGLRSCIAPPKLDRLTVRFSIKAHFAQDLHQLHTFVSRSGCIHEVRLYFNTGAWFDGRNSAFGPSYRSSLKTLFSMLVESRCEVLDVRQGHSVAFGDEIAMEQRTIFGRKCRAFLRSPMVSILGLLGIPLTTLATGCSAKRQRAMEDRSLRTFRLHSNLFFRRPFYSWMMDMFRKTPITSLSLQASDVREEEWRSFLGSITIPTLTHVAFLSPYIPFIDMLGFLSRHPRLISVYLPPHLPPVKKFPQKWKLSLPSLTTVGGCYAYLRHFLSRSLPFPSLQNILLSLPPFKRDIKVITGAVGIMIEHFAPRVLTLEFIFPSAFDELDMYTNKEYSQSRSFSFPSVEEIKFRSDGSFAFSERTLPLLSPWLATFFPSLTKVSFVTSCLFCENRVWVEFVKAVEATCPLVEDVAAYDVEDVRLFDA
ncbi:hypothetical protein M378DRAFT_757607 [Amanita muscaria Koide BX008]|uniref:F-box domain-containing protein n=1 Tax=Amanita muscaria (strain Koide BX008) TaxID=946122 RepID=A0A0C2WM02_AMAMK|nr:hypothetical protein M378DRAFT_757607 [Amanita muscaria Koide BX008]